jgi:hypothetical protein
VSGALQDFSEVWEYGLETCWAQGAHAGRGGPFLDFAPDIRRIIYTTNAIESLNSSLRKLVYQRGHFPNTKPSRRSGISLCATSRSVGTARHETGAGARTIRHLASCRQTACSQRIPELQTGSLRAVFACACACAGHDREPLTRAERSPTCASLSKLTSRALDDGAPFALWAAGAKAKKGTAVTMAESSPRSSSMLEVRRFQSDYALLSASRIASQMSQRMASAWRSPCPPA